LSIVSLAKKHAMLFASHALLGGIALYASAASAANHQVNVGDANGSLTFNPISIVSQPIKSLH
jgi:hypothetical protein